MGGLLGLATASLLAQPAPTGYVFSHLAGSLGGGGKADGIGTAARFNNATGVAMDQAGITYVADSGNNTIRKITPAGVVTTLAGNPEVPGRVDGVGSAARFSFPTGPAVDQVGNVYVADGGDNTIRKITPGGMVTTLAGTPSSAELTAQTGHADGTGTAAQFWGPSGVAVDGAGNVFVADCGNDLLRKVTPDGVVTTLSLTGTPGWPDGGIWSGNNLFGDSPFGWADWSDQFNYHSQIAVDSRGSLYVANYEWVPSSYGYPSYFLIIKVSPAGEVSTLSPLPTITKFGGLTVDKSDNLFVATQSGLVVNSSTGEVTTLGGTAGIVSSGLAVDGSGNITAAASDSILKISADGVVSTLAGMAAVPGTADGTGGAAGFNTPGSVAVDGSHNIFVADTLNSTIRRISPDGTVTTLAGTAGVKGNADGTGPAAQFYAPSSVAVDGSGNVFVADVVNGNVRRITPDGLVSTLAGVFADGNGLAADETGNVYFTFGNSVNEVTPAGVVTTLAGTFGFAGYGFADGTGPAAQFDHPHGLAVDGAGNVYVADTTNDTIRKVTPGGVVTTLAGSANLAGSADGTGPVARFLYPHGVSVDSAGNVYVADTFNDTIRRITPDGVVTTLAGVAGKSGGEDGLGTGALFNQPAGIAVDNLGLGILYVADTLNHAIRVGQIAGPPVITAQPASETVPPGATIQFSASASGTYPLNYQWYFNGSALPGATSISLNIASVSAANAGDYTLLVANVLGSATSNKATLTVSAAPVTPPTAPASSSAGGGVVEAWLVVALVALTAVRGFTTKKSIPDGSPRRDTPASR